MALDSEHAAGNSGHVNDHNLIDQTLAAHELALSSKVTQQDINDAIDDYAGTMDAIVIGSTAWLKACLLSEAILLTGNQVYDDDFDVLVSSDIAWLDGKTGTYQVNSLTDAGDVTSVTATYNGVPTQTITITIPRNDLSQIDGAMTAVAS